MCLRVFDLDLSALAVPAMTGLSKRQCAVRLLPDVPAAEVCYSLTGPGGTAVVTAGQAVQASGAVQGWRVDRIGYQKSGSSSSGKALVLCLWYLEGLSNY